jgi:hypothetical protein
MILELSWPGAAFIVAGLYPAKQGQGDTLPADWAICFGQPLGILVEY